GNCHSGFPIVNRQSAIHGRRYSNRSPFHNRWPPSEVWKPQAARATKLRSKAKDPVAYQLEASSVNGTFNKTLAVKRAVARTIRPKRETAYAAMEKTTSQIHTVILG